MIRSLRLVLGRQGLSRLLVDNNNTSASARRVDSLQALKNYPGLVDQRRPLHLSLSAGCEPSSRAPGSMGNAPKATKSKQRSKQKNKKVRKTTEAEQLELAAIEAAKSLPGEWSRTADDLIKRLSVPTSSGDLGTETAEAKAEPEIDKRSLLETMTIGRRFEPPASRKVTDYYSFKKQSKRQVLEGEDLLVAQKKVMRKRLTSRYPEHSKGLYSQGPLGIFDPAKVKTAALTEEVVTESEDLWEVVQREKTEAVKGGVQMNGFEEMIQWTKEGRMSTFPIDNEAYMAEERKYKFHEHVFLDHHLHQFPEKGPLRKFMELVVIGLSKNPHISVPEKVEHIQWFAEYFREKQDLLKSSLGEQALLKGVQA